MSVGGLLGRALLGGTAAASEGIYSQYQEDMKQKRATALENIRNNFATARDDKNYERQVERDNTNYARDTERGDATYARDRVDKVSDDQAARAHELKLASIRAKSSGSSAGAKLNPLIVEQIKGIDNELESYYKAQAEGALQPEQLQRMRWLQQQRTIMLGGGVAMPSAPAPAGGEDAGGSGSAGEEPPTDEPKGLNEQFRSQQIEARHDQRQQQKMESYAQTLSDIEANLDQISSMPMAPSVPVLQGGLLQPRPQGSKRLYLNQLDEIAQFGDDNTKTKAAELYGRIAQQ